MSRNWGRNEEETLAIRYVNAYEDILEHGYVEYPEEEVFHPEGNEPTRVMYMHYTVSQR